MTRKTSITNIKDGKRLAAQHGEVWLQPVDTVPDATFKKTKTYIVGHSETGHNHVLESKADFEVLEGDDIHDLYVRLFEPANLVHKKTFDIHETQVIVPGDYAVYTKTEYDPFADVVRAVFD
jgi:hypothetical protein